MRLVIYRITFAVMVALTVWVVFVAVRIERLNAEAGFYLPRQDEGGKWRISRENEPRNQLRGLVGNVGLLQYLFAPLLVGLAAFHSARRDSAMRRCLAVSSGILGLVALSFALYRAYLPSLGW